MDVLFYQILFELYIVTRCKGVRYIKASNQNLISLNAPELGRSANSSGKLKNIAEVQNYLRSCIWICGRQELISANDLKKKLV